MTQESVRATAERRLREEEAQSRESRLESLESAERERREDEAARLERERVKAEAAAESARLAGERETLEEKIEVQAMSLLRDLQELRTLDKKHRTVAYAAGQRVPHELHKWTVSRWLDVRFGDITGRTFDPHDGATLRERDGLTRIGKV